MPGPDFGELFAPTSDNAQQIRGSAASAAPQGTIQTLNFRLPQVTGAASMSPQYRQEQAGSSFGGAVLQSVLRTVLGSDQASGYTDLSPGGGGGSDNGMDILRMLGGGGSTMPTMPAGSGPSQAPMSTGQMDAPLPSMPDFGGTAAPRRPMPGKDIYGDRYAYEGGFAPTGSFLSNPQQAAAPPQRMPDPNIHGENETPQRGAYA